MADGSVSAAPGAGRGVRRAGLVAAGCALLLYVATLAPGTMFGEDGPTFQTLAQTGELSVAATTHEIYLAGCYLAARLPGGTVRWRVNLFTALCAALAVGLTAAGVDRWLRRVELPDAIRSRAVVLAVGLLAVNHTFWWHATTAEVYSLTQAFVAAGVWLAARFEETGRLRYAAALLATACVGALQHLQIPFLLLWWLPWLVWRVRARCGVNAKSVAAILGAGLLGSAPYALAFAYDYLVHFRSVPLTVYYALGGPFLAWMAPGIHVLPWVLWNGAVCLFWDVTPWGAAAIAYGAYVAWRADRVLFGWLFPAAFVSAAHAASYTTLDQQVFYLPATVLCAPLLARGFAAAAPRFSERRVRRATVAMVAVPFFINLLLPRPESRAEWDAWQRRRPGTTHYLTSPNMRGQAWPDEWAQAALAHAEPGARIIAYNWADVRGGPILKHFQIVEGLRRDVLVNRFIGGRPQPIDLTELFEAEIDGRALYLSTFSPPGYRMGQLLPRFDFVPDGPLTRVVRQPDTTPWAPGPALPCTGVWVGEGDGIGRRIELTVRNWDAQGLAGWLMVDTRTLDPLADTAMFRLHTSLSDAQWDASTATLGGEVDEMFGHRLTFQAHIEGDGMSGEWSLGEPPVFSGRFTAQRVVGQHAGTSS